MSLLRSRNLPEPRGELLRWSGSFATVLGIHGAILLAALYWEVLPIPPGAPPAAVMIDLAPLPAAPTPTPTEAPPVPQQSEAAPPEPQEPPPLPEPEITPPPIPEPESEIALEQPEQEPVEPQELVETAVPDPEKIDVAAPTEETAPPAAPLLADRAAAPQPGESVLPPSTAIPNWQGLMLGHLERHKRYPREAQWRKKEGVVYLQFTMDREGNVLDFRLEKSSGTKELDDEVLALIERAQPLPAPPDEVSGETLELLVPVQFSLRR